MAARSLALAAACAIFLTAPSALTAQAEELKLVTPPLSIFREHMRPSAATLPVPTGYSKAHATVCFTGKLRTGSATSVMA